MARADRRRAVALLREGVWILDHLDTSSVGTMRAQAARVATIAVEVRAARLTDPRDLAAHLRLEAWADGFAASETVYLLHHQAERGR